MFFMSTTSPLVRSVSAILIALALAMLCAPRVFAIGISPPIIPVDDMLRNSVQTHSVMLLIQDPAPRDITFTVTPRGEYAHYIKGPSEHVIPKGSTSALYTFDLEPLDAAVGTYELLLTFTEKAEEEKNADGSAGGAKVAVLQGATAVIMLGITGEERVSYEVLYGSVEDTELRIPLVGTYTVHNTGNVEWKPDRIELSVVDVKDPTNTATFDVNKDDIPAVKPLKTDTSSFSVGHTLIEGKYKGHMKFYYKDAMVAEFDTPPFNVFAPGTLSQTGELTSVTTNKEVYTLGEQVVLKAGFKNTGDVTVEADIETKIYLGDELKNLEVSRKLNVDRRQESEFQQFIKLSEPGEYTFEVTAEFGNRRSESKFVKVVVEAKGVTAIAVSSKNSFAIVGFVVVIIFFFLFVYLRRKKKEEVPPVASVPAVQAPPQPVPAAPTASAVPVVTPVTVVQTPSAIAELVIPAVPQVSVAAPVTVVAQAPVPAVSMPTPIATPEQVIPFTAPAVAAPVSSLSPEIVPVIPVVSAVPPQEAPAPGRNVAM